MKLTIDFRGLCAFVCDGPTDAATRNVDVLLVAAEETEYSEPGNIHKPVLVFPLKNFKGEAPVGSYSPFATPIEGKQWGVWSLRDRIVRVRLARDGNPLDQIDPPQTDALRVSHLDWLPDMEIAARRAAADGQGAGIVDPVCVSSNPAGGLKPISARVMLGGGQLGCDDDMRAENSWSFHPLRSGQDCYHSRFAHRASFTLETDSHDYVLFEATAFGSTSTRSLQLQPQPSVKPEDVSTPSLDIRVSITNFSSSSVQQEHLPHSLAFFDLAEGSLAPAQRPSPYKNADCQKAANLGPGRIGCSPVKMYGPGVNPDV